MTKRVKDEKIIYSFDKQGIKLVIDDNMINRNTFYQVVFVVVKHHKRPGTNNVQVGTKAEFYMDIDDFELLAHCIISSKLSLLLNKQGQYILNSGIKQHRMFSLSYNKEYNNFALRVKVSEALPRTDNTITKLKPNGKVFADNTIFLSPSELLKVILMVQKHIRYRETIEFTRYFKISKEKAYNDTELEYQNYKASQQQFDNVYPLY